MNSLYIAAGLCLFSLSAHAQRQDGSGPAAARKQLTHLQPAERLEVTLFASEPRVRNPTNIDIDARGRVWVTEGVNYRVWQKWGKLRPEGDRIVILEDTDGDGAADLEKTFYQGHDINAALGICVLGNKVIVSCSPNVFVLTDENGDDVADKKEVLFTGIKGVDHDHGVHAFVFGPDGKLYFNMGNDGAQLQRPDGTLVKDRYGVEVKNDGRPYRQGMAFRCNPDGSDLEVMGHNFRNPYEITVDSFGRMWQSDNDDDGNKGVRLNWVMDYGNYGYVDEISGAGWQTRRTNMEKEVPQRHWHLNDPGVVPNLIQTGGGSPTGIAFYEGRLVKEWRGSILHCDAGPRTVRAYPVEARGAGFATEPIDILTSTDTWFRPSDICVAEDGSLFVADWNDAGVGGHNMADQKLEAMSGRIYRVAPKGHKLTRPQLDLNSAAGAVKALQSPNVATRYLAWQKLQSLAEKEAILEPIWKGGDAYQKARAWHLLVRSDEQKYLDLAMADEDPEIRSLALRYVRAEKKDAIPVLKRLVNDPSPSVRRECALALHRSASADAPELWAELARQYPEGDRWYLEALGIGAYGQYDPFFSAWLKKAGDQWNTPGGRDIVWRMRSSKVPGLIVKILQDKNSQDSKDRYFRALDFIKGPERDAALVQLLTE